jgi:DNA-directed RNA polymerase II subunit RPB1
MTERALEMLAAGVYIHGTPTYKKGAALSDADMTVLQEAVGSQTWFDKIISIEATTPPTEHPLMYDLTVAGTRNFNSYGLIASSDSFHHSGVGVASIKGVPRIRDLLNCTTNPKAPVMTIYLKQPLNTSAEAADTVRSRLKATHLRDIVTSVQHLYDAEGFHTDDPESARITRLYEAFAVNDTKASDAPWLLCLTLDRAKMVEAGVLVMDVYRALTNAVKANVVASDDSADLMLMRLQPPNTKGVDMVTELALFEETIMGTCVKGVAGIERAQLQEVASVRYDRGLGAYTPCSEWQIKTQGSNINVVLNMEGVDAARTVTDHVIHVESRLGIEAARAALLGEFTSIYSDSTYADHRHIALLTDFMANTGQLKATSRHTMHSSGNVGALAKCSYEQTVMNFSMAGTFGEVDNVDGVSANIMLGQTAPCGSGCATLLLDEDLINVIEGESARAPVLGDDSGVWVDTLMERMSAFNPFQDSKVKPWLHFRESVLLL